MDPGPNDQKKSKPYNNYLKYSGLALQFFGAIGLAAWGGYKLDQYLGLQFPAFLLTFTLVTFAGVLYQVYRSLNNDES